MHRVRSFYFPGAAIIPQRRLTSQRSEAPVGSRLPGRIPTRKSLGSFQAAERPFSNLCRPGKPVISAAARCWRWITACARSPMCPRLPMASTARLEPITLFNGTILAEPVLRHPCGLGSRRCLRKKWPTKASHSQRWFKPLRAGFNGLIYQTQLTQGTTDGFYPVTSGSNNSDDFAFATCTYRRSRIQ